MPRSRLPVAVVFVLVALLTTLAVAGWLFWPRPAAPDSPRNVATATGTVAVEAAANPSVDANPSVHERQRTAAAVDPVADGLAHLRITTRTADGTAVPGVMVHVQRLHGGRIGPAFGRGLTDDQGRIEFAAVEPGRLYLTSDRRDRKDVEITAGLNEVDFEVEAGVDVRGRVLDPDGAPVASADVWLQTSSTAWHGGRVLGSTAADGTFALAGVPANASLGALARGFAPSALVDLDVVDKSAPPAVVELQLTPNGGELTGRVTDSAGAPIVGALVAIGDRSKSPDYEGGRVIEVWGARAVETDAAGRYTLLGVPAGSTKIAARADGFGIWRGEARVVAGQATTLDVQLERAAVLIGTVTDKDGVPEPEARVSAFDLEPRTPFIAGGQIDFDESFGHLETLTDEHGQYRLEGVTPGETWLFAQRKRVRFGGVSVALARARLELEPGSETRWDPVIDVGRSIEGVVLYRDGYAIPGLFITLHDERTGEDQILNSDREGTFRFLCLDDSTYEIRVQPPFSAPKGSNPPPRKSGIVPDRGPVEIRVDYDRPVEQEPGIVSGRVADAGQRIRNPGAVSVTLHSDAGWFRPGIQVEHDAFRVEEVKACRFRIVLKEGDTVLGSTDWFELAPAGNVDVGVITTEPGGAVRLHVARGPGTEEFEPKVFLRRDGDPISTIVVLGRGDAALVESLTAGSYEVTCSCRGMVRVATETTVAIGRTTELQIALRAGAVGTVDVWWPEGHTGSEWRGYRVVDAAGEVVQEYEGLLHTSPTRPYAMHYTLPAGRYHVAFWTDDGLSGERDFDIPASLVPPVVRLDLK